MRCDTCDSFNHYNVCSSESIRNLIIAIMLNQTNGNQQTDPHSTIWLKIFYLLAFSSRTKLILHSFTARVKKFRPRSPIISNSLPFWLSWVRWSLSSSSCYLLSSFTWIKTTIPPISNTLHHTWYSFNGNEARTVSFISSGPIITVMSPLWSLKNLFPHQTHCNNKMMQNMTSMTAEGSPDCW